MKQQALMWDFFYRVVRFADASAIAQIFDAVGENNSMQVCGELHKYILVSVSGIHGSSGTFLVADLPNTYVCVRLGFDYKMESEGPYDPESLEADPITAAMENSANQVIANSEDFSEVFEVLVTNMRNTYLGVGV